MFFKWWIDRRRRKILEKPFPADWLNILHENVRRYAYFSKGEQAKIQRYVQVFVAEKNWEGLRGVKMTDEIRVTIAAQVAIMVLYLPPQFFDNVLSILVNPEVFASTGQTTNAAGVVVENEFDRIGEAWYRGPVILSWNEVLAAGRLENYGRNVVYHEFAHQLDMLNGRVVDGTPPLDSEEQYQRWDEVMSFHYQELLQACRNGDDTLINCYGSKDRSEFFAVATETFFEEGEAMLYRHPELYEVMREYYRQNPAAWTMSDPSSESRS